MGQFDLDKKLGLAGYESRQPKDCQPIYLAQATVTSGYFGDLAVTVCPGSTAVAELTDSLVIGVGTELADRRLRLEPVGRQLQ
jgi:hypothetical protein